MGKHFEEVIFFLILGWFIWVFLGSNGDVRIERGCTPVQWGGDAITALARAAGTDYGERAKIATETVDYHCRMGLWDYFYRAQWKKDHPGLPVPGETPPNYSVSSANVAPSTAAPPISTPPAATAATVSPSGS